MNTYDEKVIIITENLSAKFDQRNLEEKSSNCI